MKPVNILVTSAGVATAVNVIQALRKSTFFKANIIAVDMSPLAAGLYLADKHFKVPPLSDPRYIDELLDICLNENIQFLFPLFSGEIEIISRNVNVFTGHSIHVMVPTPEIVETCVNKLRFSQFLARNKYPHPNIIPQDKIEEASFPLFIKPVQGSSSKNAFKIKDREELVFYLKKFPGSIVQEYVSGTEYTVDCLVYHEVVYVCSPRSRIKVKDGKSMVGKTVFHKRIIILTKSLLLDAGMNGPCNVQCIENQKGEIYIIEINPRLAAGGLPLTVAAGANIPEMMLKLAFGIPLNPAEKIKPNITMIRYLSDIFIEE